MHALIVVVCHVTFTSHRQILRGAWHSSAGPRDGEYSVRLKGSIWSVALLEMCIGRIYASAMFGADDSILHLLLRVGRIIRWKLAVSGTLDTIVRRQGMHNLATGGTVCIGSPPTPASRGVQFALIIRCTVENVMIGRGVVETGTK